MSCITDQIKTKLKLFVLVVDFHSGKVLVPSWFDT